MFDTPKPAPSVSHLEAATIALNDMYGDLDERLTAIEELPKRHAGVTNETRFYDYLVGTLGGAAFGIWVATWLA